MRRGNGRLKVIGAAKFASEFSPKAQFWLSRDSIRVRAFDRRAHGIETLRVERSQRCLAVGPNDSILDALAW